MPNGFLKNRVVCVKLTMNTYRYYTKTKEGYLGCYKRFDVGVECANTHAFTELQFNGSEGRVNKRVVEEIRRQRGE